MPDFSNRKLGKLAPSHDQKALHFATYWDRDAWRANRARWRALRLQRQAARLGALHALVAAARDRLGLTPSYINNMTKVTTFPIDGNDVYGDCVEAAAAHAVEILRANAGNPLRFTAAEVEQWYATVAGAALDGTPGPGTDIQAQFLPYWRDTGLVAPDGTVHKIDGWVVVSPGDQEEIEAALDIFEFIVSGFQLPISAQTQSVWDVPPGGTTGNGAPGSWGGHCVVEAEDSAQGTEFPTWGEVLGATWNFGATYRDEAYAVLTQDALNAQGDTPSGFNWTQLQADISQLANPAPIPSPTPAPSGKAATSTTLAIAPNPAAVGQPVTSTATVSGGEQPSGTVMIIPGGPAQLADGNASVTWTPANAGTLNAYAAYAGDANNAASTSEEMTVTVDAAAPTPDPTVVADIAQDAQTMAAWGQAYAGGNVAGFLTFCAQQAAWMTAIAAYVRGETAAMPVVPAVPQGV